MKYYIALVHKEEGSSYGVSFPDFPGCISAGETWEEALQSGADALCAHAVFMLEEGERLPARRSVEQIQAAHQRGEEDWIEWDSAMVALIPLLPPAGRSVRVNVTIDQRLLAEIDAISRNRSAFIAEAAREKLRSLR